MNQAPAYNMEYTWEMHFSRGGGHWNAASCDQSKTKPAFRCSNLDLSRRLGTAISDGGGITQLGVLDLSLVVPMELEIGATRGPRCPGAAP